MTEFMKKQSLLIEPKLKKQMSFGQRPVFLELLIKDKFHRSWSLKNSDISEKKIKRAKTNGM